LGNFFTVREVLKHYLPEVVRYFILSSHYRSPLNYSNENLDGAKAALNRFYTALQDVSVSPATDVALDDSDYVKRFRVAMDDDFNTPEAIAVLFGLANDLNRAKSEKNGVEVSELASLLRNLGYSLGLLQADPKAWRKPSISIGVPPAKLDLIGYPPEVSSSFSEQMIDEFIEKRLAARKAKNWAESDRIRDELKAQGVILEDRPDGTTDWRRV